MRKLTFAFAVLASLGGAALVQPASAAPGTPMGVAAPDAATTNVRMTHMERRMMRHRMERRMMRRHMERRMMRRHMERRMMRRM
ncbi:hypothetical protein Q8W71_02275 [Methylobacterium sp. NEAU 140]|uniref:hypothetical protein n=1 Tax=Methylobacterium sp. NEAU 140 TaxID=3064945 RepID=UPI0027326937|nr:hypothetical protein [Methylobacterium sp. NEAU 140]MDP4021435.1 hypothetical protein [Methylobacterium sp. NEAU 140]